MIFLNEEINFRKIFQQLDLNSKNILFFLNRSNYYNAVSFDDSVYRVLNYFKENPSLNKIVEIVNPILLIIKR